MTINNYNELIKKVDKMKSGSGVDLSAGEDLSIALMNLISIEEHFFFSGAKTGQDEYFDLLSQVREIRKDLLKKIVKEGEGEGWCLSKHLLAASMRLIEVGTKYYQTDQVEAKEYFNKAYELYSLFWGINLKLIKTEEIKKIDDLQLNVHDTDKNGLLQSLGKIVKKLIDCCKE